MSFSRLTLAGAAALALAGCTPHPFDRIEPAQAEVADIVCGCATSPTAECREHSAEVIACNRIVYDAHPTEYGPNAECYADAIEIYAACLRDFAAMCEVEIYESCTDTLNEALSGCPAITSSEVSAMIDACGDV